VARRWPLPAAALLGLLLVLLTALPGVPAPVVLAHAELVGSEPADGAVLATAPDRVRLYFSEPIERDFYGLAVYTSGRERIDRRDARIPANNIQSLEVGLNDAGPGVYTVVWRALSIDGHVVRGAFAYSVGVPGVASGTATLPAESGGAPFAVGAAVRWLTFLAAAVLVGGFAFVPLVLAPVFGPAADGLPWVRRATRRFLWLAWPAAVLLILLTLVALVLQAADATGLSAAEVFGSRAITRLLSGTKYGTLWLARAGLVAALLFAVAALAGQVLPGRIVRPVGLALGAALLLVLSATGHASAVAGATWLAVGADWVHLLAGALWVGGLAQLALALPAVLGAVDPGARRGLLARSVARFSLLAVVCVAAVVATGVYASVLHVPRWAELAESVYGAALSTKLLLVAPLIALGAFNLLVLRPRLARPAGAARAAPAGAGAASGARLFRRIVAAECLLAAGVLLATAVLTGLPPATASPGDGRPVQETARAGDLSVTLGVDPNQAGVNSFKIGVADAQGRPAAVERVALELGHQDMDMGTREVVAQQVGPGRFEAGGGYLSMAGRWQAEVRVRRAGMPAGAAGSESSARFDFTVGQAAGTGRPAFSPLRILGLAFTAQTGLAALVLLLSGLLLWQRGHARRRQRRPLGWAGAALAAVGVLALCGSLGNAYQLSLASAQPVVNPIPAGPESLAAGQLLYSQSCLACHGATGRGDGPAGRALRPPPADFRVHMAAGHTDGQLFDWLSNGVPGTSMPAFRDQLSVEDRWNLINYLRTFAEPAAAGAGTPGAGAAPPAAPAPAGP
jgi:copper transport protein